MIKGMTGFGSASITTSSIKGVVEIKSLNHRYFDISYYLPVGLSSLEDKIRQLAQGHIARGRITVSLKITHKESQHLSFNKRAIKEYLKEARVLQREFGLKNNLSLADVVKLPGVVETKEIAQDPESLWPLVEQALRKSLLNLVYMRKREGKSLAKDITHQLKRMMLQIRKIKTRSALMLQQKKKEFSGEEFASFQKSSDINEELARLIHFIDEIKALLHKGGSVGKNLDFIAQEMQRETNTIGSKVQDKFVSNAVIALKSKIEKIREQSQNIE